MLEIALIGSAALLGLAGMVHCAAMCGGACAALTAKRGAAGFQLARVASYAAGGALAAASMSFLGQWSQISPALRPFWTLLHVAVLAWGVLLLWRGQQPAFLEPMFSKAPALAAAGGWQPMRGPGKAVVAGGLWVAMPCGLLQSALLLAAMANGPIGGALAMAAFAVTSAGGLVLAPWAWRRWGHDPRTQARAMRLAGLMLVLASGFALLHGSSTAFAAFCASL
jgi:sulfite exporter TauE/SafE